VVVHRWVNWTCASTNAESRMPNAVLSSTHAESRMPNAAPPVHFPVQPATTTARKKTMWTPLTGMLIGVVAATGLSKGVEAVKHQGSDYTFFNEIIEVKHILDKSYVYDVDDAKLAEGALRGMVEALGDQYTVFVPASEAADFTKGLTGEYVGIGASVNTDSGWLTIVSPLEDSPALRAGLMPDDRVLAIDGVSTQNKSVDDCIKLLQGTPNTPVVLSIQRGNDKLDVTIIRDRIKTRSVKGFHRSASDQQQWEYVIDRQRRIGYIRMTQFTPGVASEVFAALEAMQEQAASSGGNGLGGQPAGLQGLILDLRFNPGGVLEEAIAIADMFLVDGVIVSTKGRAFEERITKAKAEGTLPNFPIIVMLNDQSASASEVLAGALADNDRAKVLGVRSFGKGSVQGVLKLSQGEGSEIKVTQQAYYLPSGRNITRKDDSLTWGVDPSPGMFVPMSDDELRNMLMQRRKQELISLQREAEGAKGESEGAKSEAAGAKGEAEGATSESGNTTPQLTGATPAAIPGAAEHIDWTNVDVALQQLQDVQLTAAVRALQAKIDTSAWPQGGQDAPQLAATIAGDELGKAKQFRERLIRELIRAEKRIDTLEQGKAVATTKDLWDDSKDLTGGQLEVKDKDGNVVATLKITGTDVERWLLDADVEAKPSRE
jgi:carboxyl-terminal processing protease